MKIVNKIYNLRHDSLFRNSFYLMLATAVMSGFGFFFWIINAKIFLTEEIGIATTLISVMGLIGSFSLMGFGATFIRYLPKSKNPNDYMNTGMAIVALAAFFLSGIFVALVGIISPKLSFITDNYWLVISFIFFCIMTALNVLTDSVFLAKRQAKYTLIINTIFSAAKMVLPFAFMHWGALGIFMAAALGQTIGFVLSVLVMIWKFGFRPQLILKTYIIKEVWRFSASDYLAGIFYMIPFSVLPVLITNKLGAETSAFFYIVMMIGNLLYIIPKATTGALFAEGSNDENSLSKNIKNSIRIISLLLVPAILILLFAGEFVLRIFGDDYASGGINFLRFVAISAIPITITYIYDTLFYVKKNLKAIMLINFLFALTIIILSIVLLPFGLTGVGYAWLGGNLIAALTGYLLYKKTLYK